MKTRKITILSTAALALGATLLLAPNAMAADENSKLNTAAEPLSTGTTGNEGVTSTKTPGTQPDNAARKMGSGSCCPQPDTSARKMGDRDQKATQPDNTARNKRDRDLSSVTPLDQGNSKADIDTTAQIRREVNGKKDLSVNAKNVKIITNDGRVTLRGPVDSADEKRIIGEIADRIATPEHTDNQLEVRGASAGN